MSEVWLRSNRRVLLLALLPASLLLVAGVLMLIRLDGLVVRSFAWALCAVGLISLVGLLRQLRQPRVAYRTGEVLFFLKAGGPICVPVQVVEAFFLGQGPAHLPGTDLPGIAQPATNGRTPFAARAAMGSDGGERGFGEMVRKLCNSPRHLVRTVEWRGHPAAQPTTGRGNARARRTFDNQDKGYCDVNVDCSLSLMPGLLVSVRDVAETRAAMDGGADWIDLKEPRRGALGAVDAEMAAEVAKLLAGRLPLSAAAGELKDWPSESVDWLLDVEGIQWLKLGLAECATSDDWQNRWQQAAETIAAAGKQLVAVCYADASRAKAPSFDQIVAVAERQIAAVAEQGKMHYLLIDTFDKKNGPLVASPAGSALEEWLQAARRASLSTVVAGGLSRENLACLPREGIDMIAVRGGVCAGERTGTVESELVSDFRRAVEINWVN